MNIQAGVSVCNDTNGKVTYSQVGCKSGDQQREIKLPENTSRIDTTSATEDPLQKSQLLIEQNNNLTRQIDNTTDHDTLIILRNKLQENANELEKTSQALQEDIKQTEKKATEFGNKTNAFRRCIDGETQYCDK